MMRICVGFPYMIHHDRSSTLFTCPSKDAVSLRCHALSDLWIKHSLSAFLKVAIYSYKKFRSAERETSGHFYIPVDAILSKTVSSMLKKYWADCCNMMLYIAY